MHVGEEILESAGLGFGEPRQELLDAHLDRNLLRRQQDLRPVLRALDDRLERGEQAEQVDLELGLVLVAGDRRHPLVWTTPLRRADLFALVEQPGGGLELLVLEQPPHERIAGIFLLALDARGGFRPRQQVFDLMWMSVAAITRNSPATSRFSSCISSIVPRYCEVISAIGMS